MKTYSIQKTRGNKVNVVTGTIIELTKHFSYTLEVGYSYNNKILKKPTTIKSLISNLIKSFEITEGACYNRTSITLLLN